jgi:hypothetical protein
MTKNWKHRLGIAASVIWLLLWISGYLMDPYKDLRTSAFGVTLFGITPIAIGWLSWWVLDAFKRKQNSTSSNPEHRNDHAQS